MTDIDKIKQFLPILSVVNKTDEALLKIAPDYKYHDTVEIEGNRQGLLRLAKIALHAAVNQPSKEGVATENSNSPKVATHPFSVVSIKRDEELVFEPFIDSSDQVSKNRLDYFIKTFKYLALISYSAIGMWMIFEFLR